MLVKRAVLLMAVLTITSALVATLAVGKASSVRKTYAVSGHGASAAISGKGIPGVPGSTQTSAGQIVGKPGGSGGIVTHVTFEANGASRGTTTVFLPLGSWGGPFTAKTTANADGSLTIVIKNKITFGTGRYRGATGKVTVTSHAATAAASVHTFTARGTITY